MNKIFLIIIIQILFLACANKKVQSPHDFSEIQKDRELTIITLSGSTSYFIYKDEPMGYDYDLAKDFCDFYGLRLNVKVAENSTRLLQMLLDGEGDLVAYPVPVENQLKDSIIYCGSEQISHQVLVQRKNEPSFISDVPELIGKEVYIKDNTKYHQRLANLDKELANGIIIKDIEKDTITVEDLIGMVANKTIDYTTADEYIAKLNKTYYNDIDISVVLSFEQRSSWVVRKNTPLLANALNKWFIDNNRKPIYKATLKKYFELSKESPDDITGDDVLSILGSNISTYDHLFKKYAKSSGYDWQLLAAIAYQESHFKPNLSSWAGAIGLMGLMPRTAAMYGVIGDELKDPEKNILAGASYLKYLCSIFDKIPDQEQRLKFVLAAYNGGNGHIFDARALASKYGDNPDVWDGSVEKYVELKSKPEYYNDSVVKFGYLRGEEVVNYVKQVASNRDRFKQQASK